MRDCKAITPLQKVLSNEVSLACSKNLMSALNKTGLSFSYSKDLKDIVWKAQLDDKSKGEYDEEKHVQFAHVSLVHLLIINKDDKSMLN